MASAGRGTPEARDGLGQRCGDVERGDGTAAPRGDRSRDARINEAFLLKEIDAGAALGVDVVQIDDGWQKGRTANSARRCCSACCSWPMPLRGSFSRTT